MYARCGHNVPVSYPACHTWSLFHLYICRNELLTSAIAPAQEAERQKNIEEEQQKYMQEQIEQQREKALKKKADDEQFQKQLQDSLDQEAAKWDGGSAM